MVAGRGGVTVGGQRRLARAGRGVGVRPRRVTTVAIEAVAAWWSRRRRSCSGADVELACAALAGSGRPRPVPSPPRQRACLCRYGRGMNACETSWTILWPSLWGCLCG
uniref:Uncharacterized protein n=1 Tax=Oryza sativa subsp. japonica TaxID=39947 RepID=Q67W85_ORYSJ|nr:unknown protein [Oryza sativa Japonica Group]BAD37584.1 unknown protein [Oryza sativa Japonica Group]